MRSYQASCLQDGGHSTQKESTLIMYSKEDFIPITLLVKEAPTVRNSFQTFHLHVNSSIWFRYMNHIELFTFIVLYQVTNPLKSSWRSLLSQLVNFAGSWRLATTLTIRIRIWLQNICNQILQLSAFWCICRCRVIDKFRQSNYLIRVMQITCRYVLHKISSSSSLSSSSSSSSSLSSFAFTCWLLMHETFTAVNCN